MVYLTGWALLASGLMASVQAASMQHHQHVHKNLHKKSYAPPKYDTTPAEPAQYPPSAPKHEEPVSPIAPNKTECGCTTYTTTWYGEPTLYSPPKPSTTSSTSSAAKPTTTSAPPRPAAPAPSSPPPKHDEPVSPVAPKPAPPAPKPAPPAPKPAPPAPKPAPPAPKPPASYGGGAPSGDKWAMTYTAYRSDGVCKTASEVASDMSNIKSKGFSTVRTYSTDCDTVDNVGAACKSLGMKMIVGIWIDGKGLGASHEQLNHITSWGSNGNWGMVEMVVCGNEAIFAGFTDASSLAGFIVDAKSALKAAGYNGPVTTTEPLNVIQQYAGTICPVVDVIGANLHAFFNGQTSAAGAGDLVAQQLKDLSAACGDKLPAYNLESGWPSSGLPNGVAIPGVAEQKAAIDSIVAKVGSKSAIFSYEDDTWKAPGEYNIEQYWGCSKLFE